MHILKDIKREEIGILQNLARFYVYELARYGGLDDPNWTMPGNGLYEAFDFSHYILDVDRKAYFIKNHNELAGFILLNKVVFEPNADWNMGEFFLISRFQGKGLAEKSLEVILKKYPGKWEIMVIPENKKALIFWKKWLSTKPDFKEQIVDIDFDMYQPKRILLSFTQTK